MRHEHDTHVLIDEQGVAVMSGTREEMLALERQVRSLGQDRVAVRAIDEPVANWDWSKMNWGD